MKIAVLGCGKRFTNVYFPILKELKHEIFLWNRTLEKAGNFCKKEGISLIKDFSELEQINPDVVLCFIPPAAQPDILEKLKINCSVLVETPAENQKLLSLPKVGVLEQWPLLPLEQFKKEIYKSGIISRPYLTFNDGRSFDYHAIAQLRTYTNYPLPVVGKGSVKSYFNEGIVDSSTKINSTPHEWTLGQVEMSDGSLLQYSFAYNCKSLLSIPIQFIRAYSTDGAIVTGRMKEMGNDYEFVDVRYVDKATKKINVCEVSIDRKENMTVSISIKDKGIEWRNPYSHLNFDDQQTAIATLIEEALKGNVYSYQNAYIDYMCINMIKMSAYQQQVIKVK